MSKKNSLLVDLVSVGVTLAGGKTKTEESKATKGLKFNISDETRAKAVEQATSAVAKARALKEDYDVRNGKEAKPAPTGKIGQWQEKAKKASSDAMIAKAVNSALDLVATKPEAEQTTASGPVRESSQDLTARLKSLKQLHTDGVLDDEEFAQAKRKLLGRF